MPSTKYFLIDDKSKAEWDFQPSNHNGQLQNIDGVGFEKTKAYSEINGFFLTTQSTYNQNIITGEMVFTTEEKYAEFANLIKSDSLTLKRISSLNDTVYIDVSIDVFKKNEADRFNEELSFCDINFVATSPWYRSKKTYEYKPITEQTKKYGYIYPYQYFANVNSNYGFRNESKSDACVIIYIYGESKNPKWTYITPKGNVSSGKYIGIVPDGRYLKIDGTPNSIEVAIYDYQSDEKIQDVYKDCDLSLETFVSIAPGYATLRISDDEQGDKVLSRIEVKEIEHCP